MTLDPATSSSLAPPKASARPRDPQEWMWPGDTISAHVEGIGTITHPIVGA